MSVTNDIANGYLQLGLGGAALLLVLVFIILEFKSKDKGNSVVEKLCDKIDNLITSNAIHTEELNKVLISNDKDQQETLKALKRIETLSIDTQRRVARVDDRTFYCLGNPKSNNRNTDEGKEVV